MIEVVDDFYDRPETVREFALQRCEWSEDGLDAHRHERARTRERFLGQEVLERIAARLGKEAPSAAPRSGSGQFAVAGEPTGELPEPRLGPAEWVAVIDLTLPEQVSGGIAFFETVDVAQRQPEGPPGEWTETLQVPFRFNRMILYRASAIFHLEGAGSRADPASVRLAQIFSFDGVGK